MAANISRAVTVNVELVAKSDLKQKLAADQQQVAKLQQQAARGVAVGPAATGAGRQQPTAMAEELTKATRKLEEERAKFQIGSSAAGARMLQETARLDEANKAQKQLNETRGKYQQMISPQGQRGLVEQARLTREIARNQEWATRVAERGRVGGALSMARDRMLPATQAAGALGVAGLTALGAAAMGTSPMVADHVTNSFRLLTNEIGIAMLPALVQFTGVVQQAAGALREMDPATRSRAGNAALLGGGGLLALGGLGIGVNALTGLATLAGKAGEFGASLGRGVGLLPPAGQAGGRGFFSPFLARGLGWGATAFQFGRDIQGQFSGRRQQPWWAMGLNLALGGWPGALGLTPAPTESPEARARRVARAGGARAEGRLRKPEEEGAPKAAGAGVRLLASPEAQLGTAAQMWERLVLRSANTVPELEEQRLRAEQALTEAINSLNENITNRVPRQRN